MIKMFERFRGIVNQCNGNIIKLITLEGISSNELKNSSVPENCLGSLGLMLDSGRESYRIHHTKSMRGGVYIGMQTATNLLEDFEEVKQRVAYHASLNRKLHIEISETRKDLFAKEFLITDFRVPIQLTQNYLGDLIERYEKEFRVRDVQICYQNLPKYTYNKLLKLGVKNS